jgi:hypothetical protein
VHNKRVLEWIQIGYNARMCDTADMLNIAARPNQNDCHPTKRDSVMDD